MIIREYESADLAAILTLFHETVHTVNARDYTPEQLDAWTSGRSDAAAWDQSLREHYTLVAVDGDRIVGFGDITETGYLDRLYVHKDCQHQGIASLLCDHLEVHCPDCAITTQASITAKPFFEARGYRVIKEQQVERMGVLLMNYLMKKEPMPCAHTEKDCAAF